MEILLPVLILGAVGVVFGIGLAFASKFFHVDIDPRLEKIHGLLPGANCGACGGAGCFGFAEQILAGTAMIDSCRAASDEAKEEIARVLGRQLTKTVRMVAVLHCNGGAKVKDKFVYEGIQDCVAASLQLAGPKECVFGCIGFGTCAKACPFGAISMSKENLPVVNHKKCKACNKCVEACPKKLFTLAPETHPVVVACSSHDAGRETKFSCPVGCIACRLCEKACTFDAIHVVDNLAQIDYNKCTSCGACVKACPTKAIREKKHGDAFNYLAKENRQNNEKRPRDSNL